MLGFSIPKILLLIFIILLVWYAFKVIEKRTSLQKTRSSNKDKSQSSKYKSENTQDLEKCPACSNYFMPGSKCTECNPTK